VGRYTNPVSSLVKVCSLWFLLPSLGKPPVPWTGTVLEGGEENWGGRGGLMSSRKLPFETLSKVIYILSSALCFGEQNMAKLYIDNAGYSRSRNENGMYHIRFFNL
jgi:hypothetical protein